MRLSYFAALTEPERMGLLASELASPRMLRTPYRAYSQETNKELEIVDKAARLRSQPSWVALDEPGRTRGHAVKAPQPICLLVTENQGTRI